jgi:SAM-dependent methyltransferase
MARCLADGFAQVERAVSFVKNKGVALDVGCGTGRVKGLLGKHGFRTDGLEVSPVMIALHRTATWRPGYFIPTSAGENCPVV